MVLYITTIALIWFLYMFNQNHVAYKTYKLWYACIEKKSEAKCLTIHTKLSIINGKLNIKSINLCILSQDYYGKPVNSFNENAC